MRRPSLLLHLWAFERPAPPRDCSCGRICPLVPFRSHSSTPTRALTNRRSYWQQLWQLAKEFSKDMAGNADTSKMTLKNVRAGRNGLPKTEMRFMVQRGDPSCALDTCDAATPEKAPRSPDIRRTRQGLTMEIRAIASMVWSLIAESCAEVGQTVLWLG